MKTNEWGDKVLEAGSNLRGRLLEGYGSVRKTEEGGLFLRIDDARNPSFWLEVWLKPEKIKELLT